jgi:GH24 family phage-related lysozyme (muramidase)
MKLGTKGFNLIKEFEGCLKPIKDRPGYYKSYLCPAKVWTIGWGCTEGVGPNMVWSQKQCDDAFRKELKKHEDAVKGLLKEFNFKPNQNQFDALVSHSYNCGPGGTRKVMKAGFNFNAYGRTAKGKVLPGLVRRRKAEQVLFNTPTDKEIVKDSRQLTWNERLDKFLKYTSITSLVSWATFEQVRSFITDPKMLVVIGVAGLLWLVVKYNRWSLLRAAKEGRYTPSKKTKRGKK